MPLPSRYVDEIHMRMAVRYGSAWLAKWAGVDMNAIKADWAEQLDGMKPDHIRAALANLPDDFPPTCTAFRKLGAQHAPKAEETSEYLRIQALRGTGATEEIKARLMLIASKMRKVA